MNEDRTVYESHEWTGNDPDYCARCHVEWEDADTTCEPVCTCTELQRMTVCHDMRNEPHVIGCPRWGTPKGKP